MTDQSVADIETRVRAALDRLAESHHPNADLHRPGDRDRRRSRHSGSTSRWWLAAASVVIVAAGVVGTAFVTNRDAVAPTDTAPVTLPLTTDSTAPATTVPAPGEQLRFDQPLEPGTIATLHPAPAEPVAAYDTSFDVDEWGYGRDGYATVWVLEANEWVGELAVIDQAVPWDIATAGATVTQIAGTDAVASQERFTVALRLGNGGTRVIHSSNDGPLQPEMYQAAVELAGVIGAGPVGATLPTDRFTVPVGTSVQQPLVRYGTGEHSDSTTEVITYRLERTPTDDELRWIAASIAQGNRPEAIDRATFEGTLDGGQRSLVELVSPLDVVAILAPAGTDMRQLRGTLEFEALDESGLTVEKIDQYPTPQVVARGEQTWGRWQVATSTDGSCRSVAHVLWTAGELSPIPSGASTCDPDQPFSSAICSSVGPGTVLVIALGADADSVDVELNGEPVPRPVENGDGGAAVLVDDVPPGPNPLTVTIDGAPTDCSAV